MTTQRARTSRLAAGLKQRPSTGKFSAGLFPIHSEIQRLEDDLHAFNERIVELENSGHTGHAREVLKANAIDMARKIDELLSLLAEPRP